MACRALREGDSAPDRTVVADVTMSVVTR